MQECLKQGNFFLNNKYYVTLVQNSKFQSITSIICQQYHHPLKKLKLCRYMTQLSDSLASYGPNAWFIRFDQHPIEKLNSAHRWFQDNNVFEFANMHPTSLHQMSKEPGYGTLYRSALSKPNANWDYGWLCVFISTRHFIVCSEYARLLTIPSWSSWGQYGGVLIRNIS